MFSPTQEKLLNGLVAFLVAAFQVGIICCRVFGMAISAAGWVLVFSINFGLLVGISKYILWALRHTSFKKTAALLGLLLVIYLNTFVLLITSMAD